MIDGFAEQGRLIGDGRAASGAVGDGLGKEPEPVCLVRDACARYPDLAEIFGHDLEGHAIIGAVLQAGITDLKTLEKANLHDIRLMGPKRILRVRVGLAERKARTR